MGSALVSWEGVVSPEGSVVSWGVESPVGSAVSLGGKSHQKAVQGEGAVISFLLRSRIFSGEFEFRTRFSDWTTASSVL